VRDYDQYVKRPAGKIYRKIPVWENKSIYLRESLTAEMVLGVIEKMAKESRADTAERLLQIGGKELLGDVYIEGNRNYSVAVPFIFGKDDVFLLLTKRSSNLDVDPGHISFPGGKLEKGESFYQAALREAKEEIDLDIDDITASAFIGMFERPLSEVQKRYIVGPHQRKSQEKIDFDVEVSGNGSVLDTLDLSDQHQQYDVELDDLTKKQKIAAFALTTEADVRLHPNKDEVEKIFKLPVRSLFALDVAWNEIWVSEAGESREINFFGEPNIMGNNLIWGLTARIIAVILEHIALSV